MNDEILTEAWLAGPVDRIPDLLQPVAHALIQSNREIQTLLQNFNEDLLWQKPAGIASVAFHLQHIAGIQDRLFAYAKGLMLNEKQLAYLSSEGIKQDSISLIILLNNLHDQTQQSLEQLQQTDVNTLTETRGVGRKQTHSTVIGLLVHAAEHTMRHTGQLHATVKLLPSFTKPISTN